jgi:hypothetical protein
MTPDTIAILSTGTVLLGAIIGGIVELRKTRVATKEVHVATQQVQHEVRPNTGGSMRDAVDRTTAAISAIGGKMDRLADLVHDVDKRVTRVEARTEFLILPAQREAPHVK